MILESENLEKTFKNKDVLKNVTFQVNEGEVHAILGKNGAGKSTFIKIALGLIFPTSGRILVYNNIPGSTNNKIGYLSENITLYPHLSAKDNIKVTAYSRNIKISEEKIAEILSRIDLTHVENKPSKSFSLGMKRRLQLAMSTMVKEVDFLILDEPTNGLDVNGLIWLKKYINELRKSGVSILLASHAIFDLQECITDYAIINNGTIARRGKWDIEQGNTTGIKIIVTSDELKSTLSAISIEDDAISYDENGHIYWQTDKNFKEACQFLYERGVFPENVSEIRSSLESIFLETISD